MLGNYILLCLFTFTYFSVLCWGDIERFGIIQSWILSLLFGKFLVFFVQKNPIFHFGDKIILSSVIMFCFNFRWDLHKPLRTPYSDLHQASLSSYLLVSKSVIYIQVFVLYATISSSYQGDTSWDIISHRIFWNELPYRKEGICNKVLW